MKVLVLLIDDGHIEYVGPNLSASNCSVVRTNEERSVCNNFARSKRQNRVPCEVFKLLLVISPDELVCRFHYIVGNSLIFKM